MHQYKTHASVHLASKIQLGSLVGMWCALLAASSGGFLEGSFIPCLGLVVVSEELKAAQGGACAPVEIWERKAIPACLGRPALSA